MRKLVLLAVFGLITFASQAQTATKVGYADVEYIFSQMPESKQIDAELKSMEAQLKGQIEAKIKKFQAELKLYQEQGQTMIDAVRQNTERELTQQQQNIEKLQQDAQTTLQNKSNQMLTPVYDKVGKAIEDVAKENGFSFILSQQVAAQDVILYGDDKLDISDLVLKKMGVTVAPKPLATTPK
ncbi:MAG TPA: OmpH family outer membrane protein [Chryseolinea sp.]|nr:OmpH family outer membrane protein [Chryseolinea sp.]HPM31346.1 OmpH family outer membrane protein [Chryseolinea sp.]